MDSMLDLEQLRTSIIEQDVPSAIGQVHQWIDTHGLAMLEANQRLPFNYNEAEAIRKDHEKIELKCMTFLAFYAKINLKNIPEQYQEMREEMDIKIHKFSEHIKARRHVVVSFYTFFRHIEKLQEKLADVQNEDLSNLPDSIEEINDLIETFNQNITNCLKRLGHLKTEADRVKTSLKTIASLNNSPSFDYIDRRRITESIQHIDTLLQEMEDHVTRMYETQRILELELKIESKMMLIEDNMTRCCAWLRKIEQKLVDTYKDRVVGMTTVESDVLRRSVEELVNKMKTTNDYGNNLMQMYEQLCLKFKRDPSRGEVSKDKLEELWQLGELISTESLNRLTKAEKLFHGLDSTLNKVEDMLLSINKDKETNVPNEEIVDKYKGVRNEALAELKDMKRSANELFSKLRFDLYNKKVKTGSDVYLVAEETEDMVKMKIFTIVIKLKELDRCISADELPEMDNQTVPVLLEIADDDRLDNINKYIKFLKTNRLNWETKSLPKTFNEANKALQEHEHISDLSEQYWNNIQAAVGPMGRQTANENANHQKLLTLATREKNNWDEKWTLHLNDHLNPRYQLLKHFQDFNNDLDAKKRVLDDLVNRPNNNLQLTKDLKKDSAQMKSEIPKMEQTFERLNQNFLNIHKTDFQDALDVSKDKLLKYKDHLNNFVKLENIIERILEFLPELSHFKKQWPNRVEKCRKNPSKLINLRNEANDVETQIASFDVNALKRLATVTYGNSKRVEWLVDELKSDFVLPVIPEAREEYITPAVKSVSQMSGFDQTDCLEKEITVNSTVHAPTELNFDVDNLSRVVEEQYDIIWYKDGIQLDPTRDPRITTVCEPRRGLLLLGIDECDYGDAGKYWCEIQMTPNDAFNSYPIILKVSPNKAPSLGKVVALFDEQIFAGRNDPLTLELKLDGYRFAPDAEMRHENKPINVNQRNSPWTRISSSTHIEFTHPAISNSDGGRYEFMVDDRLVANTDIVVGDAPKLFQHHFNEKFKVSQPVSITIPTANIANKADQQIIWLKDGIELTPESGKFNWRINKTGDPVFEVAQVRPSHAGVYTCEVFNEYGRTSAQIVIEVIVESKISGSENTLMKSSPLNNTVEDVVANVGESVTLAINFAQTNNSEIVWTKDGTLITGTDPRLKISNDNNSRCVLHIDCARFSDGGFYSATVKGTNRKHSVNLEVTPQAPGPVIEKYPQNVRVKVNEPLNIECVVKSVPPCDNVMWTLTPIEGGSPKTLINNARCKLTTKNTGSHTEHLEQVTLNIGRSSRSDAGEYVLRCDNNVGWSSVKIPVVVVDEAQNKKKPPTFVQPLKRELIARGDEPVVLKCKVIGNPFPTVKWQKNDRVVMSSDFLKTRNMGELHELSILNPRAHDSGTYEAVATNSEGTESSRCLVKVHDPTDEDLTVPDYVANNESTPDQVSQRTQLIFSNTVVRSPPQFVTTFTDQIVQEGEDVYLKCCLLGQPDPVVYWSYNTHLLKNPRFEASRQINEYTLSMRNVKEEDSGRYSMTAENSSGLATCSALVIVDKNNVKGKALDRSQYKTNSKPSNSDDKRGSGFPCHTTLSHSMNSSLPDESRIMQVSPRGWIDNKARAPNSPRPSSKLSDIDVECNDNLDFTKSRTKTVKTYHYSGPSGVDLPGIGFIPKTQSSSASSDDTIGHAVFVPGVASKVPVVPPRPALPDAERFSYVESSECDYPL